MVYLADGDATLLGTIVDETDVIVLLITRVIVVDVTGVTMVDTTDFTVADISVSNAQTKMK